MPRRKDILSPVRVVNDYIHRRRQSKVRPDLGRFRDPGVSLFFAVLCGPCVLERADDERARKGIFIRCVLRFFVEWLDLGEI